MNGRILAGMALTLAAIGLGGCGSSGPRTLSSNMFVSPTSSEKEPATAPSIASTAGSIELAAPRPLPIISTAQPSTAMAATIPSTAQAMETGSYMTLGGVVADVNGTPIYANTLLAMLDKELAAKATEMDAAEFRSYARRELENARSTSIQDEVEFAAADRGLSADDKKIVELVMTQYLQQKITEAGGSIELARRKSEAEGLTFEQMMHKHHREITWELYRQHRIMPRVQVSADDMRDFYLANVDHLYSQRNEAKFRVIKIDPARLGGDNPKAAARERIRSIRAKAVRGDDFTALASSENHDDYLKSRGGDPGGWLQRDCYRIDAVDKAIWKIEPGQITQPIEDDGVFYIAKLEDRKIGKIQPFDDPAVQADIMNRLRSQQLTVLFDQLRMKLIGEAVIRGEPGDSLLDPAVDIAMQRYSQWAAR
jgi:parvulin-like peptidyl-prolyl isomerase